MQQEELVKSQRLPVTFYILVPWRNKKGPNYSGDGKHSLLIRAVRTKVSSFIPLCAEEEANFAFSELHDLDQIIFWYLHSHCIYAGLGSLLPTYCLLGVTGLSNTLRIIHNIILTKCFEGN